MSPIGAIQELGPPTADRGAGRRAGARLLSRGSPSLIRLPGGWGGGQQAAAQPGFRSYRSQGPPHSPSFRHLRTPGLCQAGPRRGAGAQGQAGCRGEAGGAARGFHGHSQGCMGRVEQAPGSPSCVSKAPESPAVLGSSARAGPNLLPVSIPRPGHLGLVTGGDTHHVHRPHLDTGWQGSRADRAGAQPRRAPR